MEPQEKFTLIEGVFEPNVATELISVLFSTKIDFHNRNMLKTKEESGAELPQEEIRVADLKNTRMAFQQKMKEAEKYGFHVKITSRVEVSFV